MKTAWASTAVSSPKCSGTARPHTAGVNPLRRFVELTPWMTKPTRGVEARCTLQDAPTAVPTSSAVPHEGAYTEAQSDDEDASLQATVSKQVQTEGAGGYG